MTNSLPNKFFSLIYIFVFLFITITDCINCNAEETQVSPGMIHLGGGYYKIDNKIFWRWRQIKSPLEGKPVKYIEKLLSDADAETFIFLSQQAEGVWGKDKNNIYFFNEKISGADIETWEPLDMGYSKDKNYVFNGSEKTDKDPKTFKVPYGEN